MSATGQEADDDPLASIREHEDAVEYLAQQDDRLGAIARYFLALARGELPDPQDCRMADLPDPREQHDP